MFRRSRPSSRLLPIVTMLCIGTGIGVGSVVVFTESPRFYRDDPIAREPESKTRLRRRSTKSNRCTR